MSSDLILGWILGLLSSLFTGLVMFWIEGMRETRKEIRVRRLEDSRIANNYGADGKKPSLRGFDLTQAKLSGKDLSGADLEDSSMMYARLWGTNLRNANLRQVNFRYAKLKGVDCTNAILRAADFTGTELIDVDFSGTNLQRAKLGRAKKIDNCTWKNVIIDDETEMSEDIKKEIQKQLHLELEKTEKTTKKAR